MTGDGPPVQSSSGVVLRTARLDMRPLTRAHLPDMLALYEDPRVTEFLVDLDEAGHVRRLEETERMWATHGLGRVAIHERATGRFVGRGGLHHWAQFGEVEVGWALRADAWGRGYATESARGWLDWGMANLDVPYLTAYVAPDNTASRAVAERSRMSVLRTDTFHGRDVLVYALHRAEAEQLRTGPCSGTASRRDSATPGGPSDPPTGRPR